MSDQQFEIDVPAVLNLAQGYHSEAQGLGSDTAGFCSGADRIGQAFGLLGVCDGAAQQYDTLLDSVLKALSIAGQTLDAEAEQLAQTVSSYLDTEQALCRHFDRVQQSF